MATIRIPPIFTVYCTTPRCFLKNSSRVVVNKPTARNGSTNPRVYTPIRTNPAILDAADAAIKSTLVRAGPTQGVHAKLKVNPIKRAVTGDIASLSS